MATLSIKGMDGVENEIQLFSTLEGTRDYSADDTGGRIAIYDGSSTLYPFTSKTEYSDVKSVCAYYDKTGTKHYLYVDRAFPYATDIEPKGDGKVNSMNADSGGGGTYCNPDTYPNGARIYLIGGRGGTGSVGSQGSEEYLTGIYTPGDGGAGGTAGYGAKATIYPTYNSDSNANFVAYAGGGNGGGGGGGGSMEIVDGTAQYGLGGAGGEGSRGGCIVIDVPVTESVYFFVNASTNTLTGMTGRTGYGGKTGTYDSATGTGLGGSGGSEQIRAGAANNPVPATDINGANGRDADPDYMHPVGVDENSYGCSYYRGSNEFRDKLIELYALDEYKSHAIVEAL